MTLFFFVNQLRFLPRTDHFRHRESNNLFVYFFWRSPPLPRVLTLIPETFSSSHHKRSQSGPQKYVTPKSGPRHTEKVGHGNKLSHKNLWLLKMGHGTKNVENH